MNCLKVGFGRVNITPMLGIPMEGYFTPRFAESILDDLELNVLALEAGEARVLLVSIDNCEIYGDVLDTYRRHVSDVTGVPEDAIFIASTHTHTGPCLISEAAAANYTMFGEPLNLAQQELIGEYRQFVYRRIADAAIAAIADLKPAKMGTAVGHAPDVAFVRLFRMKDGTARTNPGKGNPDILCPIGDVDDRVNVLRFHREGAEDLVLVNFGNHPDTIGGCGISADWPGFLRRSFEKAVDGTRCIFFNGAQGDVNHLDLSDTNDLNGRLRAEFGPTGFAQYIGRVVAGAVMQVYDRVTYRDVDDIRYCQKIINAPSNMPRPEQMDNARKIVALHEAGRDDLIPEKGMEVTTAVSEALRMVRLEHGPESFPLLLSAVSVGNVALFGIPGEPFTGIGRAMKETEGWDLVLPCGLVNAYWDYFPTMEAYEAGGYEARSSSYKAGVAELIVAEGKKLLAQLK